MHINENHPDHKVRDRAYIIHPILPGQNADRALDDIIEEAEGLARAIELDVIKTHAINVSRLQSGHFIGKGQRETIGKDVEDLNPDIIIVNASLSPVQQRNLERDWNKKVIDRTGLILEIFGARAQTKEGRLQVELAALDYQRSRLVRSWTHLERQRGGAGFMGGPGERQIEIDRRLIAGRITKLKKELNDVRRTRDLGRENRARVPYPVIALVGYTNAGKSTLFNRLTGAGVFAEDLPFATLDPTLRKLTLASGQDAILSDTVGFISDLPTHLVASFRATLEQITHADVIIHVIDVSRPDWDAQKQDVNTILKDLEIEPKDDPRVIEAFNKIDVLPEDEAGPIHRASNFSSRRFEISAVTGAGIEALLEAAQGIISSAYIKTTLTLPIADGKALSWLYDHADVLERVDNEQEIELTVRIDPGMLSKYEQMNMRAG